MSSSRGRRVAVARRPPPPGSTVQCLPAPCRARVQSTSHVSLRRDERAVSTGAAPGWATCHPIVGEAGLLRRSLGPRSRGWPAPPYSPPGRAGHETSRQQRRSPRDSIARQYSSTTLRRSRSRRRCSTSRLGSGRHLRGPSMTELLALEHDCRVEDEPRIDYLGEDGSYRVLDQLAAVQSARRSSSSPWSTEASPFGSTRRSVRSTHHSGTIT